MRGELMKKIVIGILAHVDAGKTTLSEAMLYQCGCIRKLGRVDHGDAFLDTFALEKERGITIFSKQARLKFNDVEIILLDTPGHVDFSTETERTLRVLDYAILVISATDGVQSHSKTLWKLLNKYEIPTFIFVNKMDLNVHNHDFIINDLQRNFNSNCVDFSDDSCDDFFENVASLDENLLDEYLKSGYLSLELIKHTIKDRKIFPCYFGSALKNQGIDEFLKAIEKYTITNTYPLDFAAKVYKVSRDSQGARLVYMKITGGTLKTKSVILKNGIEEKVNQIRIYSGIKYTTLDEVEAGDICAVTGLNNVYAGDNLGAEKSIENHILEPVLTYKILFPKEINPHDIYLKMKELEEEEPQLNVSWDSQNKEIHVQLMGEVQIDVIKYLFFEHFGINIEFGTGNIVYKETVTEPVEGIGHFEPLRHYAEVHVMIEPQNNGGEITYDTVCNEDELARNWQRLIISNLEEKNHLGVLIGAPLTDVKITLVAGKAHEKHTEGGDFRQAACRAVRQGLMKSKSVVLEPFYKFEIILPYENLGRAMTDILTMYGEIENQTVIDDYVTLVGTAPVSTMRDYAKNIASYSKGKGKIVLAFDGYRQCHNQNEVIEKISYDPEADIENTPDSVFCSHGAGHIVKWNDVEKNMHLPLFKDKEKQNGLVYSGHDDCYTSTAKQATCSDDELMKIYEQTYGTIRRRDIEHISTKARVTFEEHSDKKMYKSPTYENLKEYLLIDGYNIIYSWEELKNIAKTDMKFARNTFINILSNFQAYKKCDLIVVFDAYNVKDNVETVEKHNGIYVIYTKQSQTADTYIERVSKEIGKKYRTRVATSDAQIQTIVFGNGAFRMTPKELKDEIISVNREIEDVLYKLSSSSGNRDIKLEEFFKKNK